MADSNRSKRDTGVQTEDDEVQRLRARVAQLEAENKMLRDAHIDAKTLEQLCEIAVLKNQLEGLELIKKGCNLVKPPEGPENQPSE